MDTDFLNDIEELTKSLSKTVNEIYLDCDRDEDISSEYESLLETLKSFEGKLYDDLGESNPELCLIESAYDKYIYRFPIDSVGEESVIRISKMSIKNFKGVAYGEIDFKFGKKLFTPYTSSDVLGIYGQNGSGKTAVIEAIRLLKILLSGLSFHDPLGGTSFSEDNIHPIYMPFAEYINQGANFASFKYSFDYIVGNETLRTIEYSFCLGRGKKETWYLPRDKALDMSKQLYEGFKFKHVASKGVIFNEKISIGGIVDGKKTKMQPVIDMSTDGILFTPASKVPYFINGLSDDEEKALLEEINKNKGTDCSCIFKYCLSRYNNDYAMIIRRLWKFGMDDLHILINDGLNSLSHENIQNTYADSFSDTTFHFYAVNDNFSFSNRYSFSQIDSTVMDIVDVKRFIEYLDSINPLINAMLPGISLAISVEEVANHQDEKLKKNCYWECDEETFDEWINNKRFVDLYVEKEGKRIPYRCESIGIRRLISEISLFVLAYNNPEITLAIDEFDAGIFEFLLGELLQIFEESGKGQLIFTAHNLRPLEVLNKKSICFTSTNPNNRYVRMKNLCQTNNLRSTYFREIILGEQDEELYKSTKKHKLMAAMRTAGKQV